LDQWSKPYFNLKVIDARNFADHYKSSKRKSSVPIRQSPPEADQKLIPIWPPLDCKKRETVFRETKPGNERFKNSEKLNESDKRKELF